MIDQEQVADCSQEKLELEIILADKLNYINEIEAKLHLKSRECIQLKAMKMKAEDEAKKRSSCSKDLKDCIDRQDAKMMQLINSSTLDKASLTKALLGKAGQS